MTAEDVDDDVEDIEATVPTLGQAMNALDLLRISFRMHTDTEDGLDALQIYEKSVPQLLKHLQANITEFFGEK